MALILATADNTNSGGRRGWGSLLEESLAGNYLHVAKGHILEKGVSIARKKCTISAPHKHDKNSCYIKASETKLTLLDTLCSIAQLTLLLTL